jgi:GxxExxY protein
VEDHRSSGRPRRGVALSELDPKLTEISRQVIGCAIDVHKGLGPGFEESVYAAALQNELDDAEIMYKADHPIDVMYKDKKVGEHHADLYVNDRFLVEVMAVHGQIGSIERATLRAQLRAADLELGLIINFGERRLKDGLVRVLNPDKLNAQRENEEHDDHDNDAQVHEFDEG